MRKLLFLLMGLSAGLYAQDFKMKLENRVITQHWTVDPRHFHDQFDMGLKHIEAPFPGGNSAKAELMALKLEVNNRYPRTANEVPMPTSRDAGDSLTKITDFPADFFFTKTPLQGGTPNDNTLAISDDGKLLTSWNSQIWGYDMVADTYLFHENSRHPSFLQFLNVYSDTAFSLYFPFDPKLLYHADRDRFVLVFLTGRDPSNSAAIVAFSSTNNPSDVWHAYRIGGNPLSYDTWTDYPQMAFTENSLFLSLNQLYPDSGWVEGFAETVIWQMDLDAGFSGADSLTTKFWSGIQYQGGNLRYVRPVKNGYGPESDTMYFVANRPFDIVNDTFFLLRIIGDVDDAGASFDAKLAMADTEYGLPPYAEQGGGQFFWTNDARPVGALRLHDEIHFVGNCVVPQNGKAGIYHGIIDDFENPSVDGHIITHPDMEFGFPNLDFTGVDRSDKELAIFFNHTAIDVPAGNSVVYFNAERQYGPIQVVKQGETYVNADTRPTEGIYERWGDYTGIQRRYNATSQIWVSGYWGFSNNAPGTWIAKLAGPNDDPDNDPDNPEHQRYWPEGLNTPIAQSKFNVFPNPSTDRISVEFFIGENAYLEFTLKDVSGRQIAQLGKGDVKAGKNLVSFNLSSLARGTYILEAHQADGRVLAEKIIKE